MSDDTTRTGLKDRSGLPDALRILLEELPRDQWEANPGYSELVRFWLERHIMFRRLLATLDDDARQMIDRGLDVQHYTARLSRFGGMLVNQLHGHHQIEDLQFFPPLKQLDPRLDRGFEMLERDHLTLDGLIERFTVSANKVLETSTDQDRMHEEVGAFETELAGFGRLLDRHLNDEEELIVPVILKNGFDALP